MVGKNLARGLRREERRKLVDWENRELPVSTQAELSSLNRSGVYYQPVPPSVEEVALKHRMVSYGRALDNSFTERLWRTIQYEEVYVKEYASPREARDGLRDYLRFYNEQRLHQALDLSLLRLQEQY